MARGDSGTASGPLDLFCARLKRLQLAAGITQTSLADAAHLSTTQMSDILNGKIRERPKWEVTATVVRACLEHGERTGRLMPPDLRDEDDWERRYFDLEQDLDTGARPRHEALAGWPLAGVTDPFALEVHRPVQHDTPQHDLPVLPLYLPREHDSDLGQVVMAAVRGGSSIAVLVGGSSTGKTRACWEALRLLRDSKPGWRLWHPIDPSRPEAALRELPSIGPRTVVWLNEGQFYLDVAADGLGERIAAGLRELLRDPARAPVLVLATLWPQFWDRLTARPPANVADPHAQARELLAGQDISVPAAFTATQLQHLAVAADPRLARAAEAAEDGQVIQFLAGAPELMARYRNAPPAAAALISAAIDARRLGMGLALPLAFLEAAAPDYLSDTQWDPLSENWLEQALAYTAAPCNGIRGPLSRMRPGPANDDDPNRGPIYRLADYLDQYGRHTSRQIPPASFWDASARYAALTELPGLARYAKDYGQLRDAARLRKQAAAQGDTYEAANLIEELHSRDADPAPARWAAAHASLDDPKAVVRLLNMLRETGAQEQATALTARDPAAHASLNDLGAVNRLIDALHEAGSQEQAAALAARAAAHASLNDPGDVARLLDALRETCAQEQATALAARDPAAHANLAFPGDVNRLVEALREAGAEDQADALAAREAAYPRIDDEAIIAEAWNAVRERSAEYDEAVFARFDPDAGISLADYDAIDRFLDELRQAATQEQKAAVTARAAEHVRLDLPVVTMLVHRLQEARAQDVAAAVAARAAQRLNLDDTDAVTEMLSMLRRAGGQDEAHALAARAVKRVTLTTKSPLPGC